VILTAAVTRSTPKAAWPSSLTVLVLVATLAEKRQLYLDGADPMLLMRHEQGGRRWPELIEQARAYCAEHEIGVLVIDTWDKWTGLRGDDESKAGAVIEASSR
jgi:hypothetical protein